jgi:DNA adenine methylase
MIQSILRYPGAKWRVAEWLVSHFPKHQCYLEPFFGSGAAFFTKQPSSIEILNDIDSNVINLFQVMREYPLELCQQIELTPWSQDEYASAVAAIRIEWNYTNASDIERLERARVFLVAHWQMFGRKNVTSRKGWSWRYTKAPVSVWNKLPERLEMAVNRLRNAQIANTDAIELIRQCNQKDVLIYCDPPYLGETRSHGRMYEHEMKEANKHLELIQVLQAHCGPAILSGYESSLYQAHLANWIQFKTAARAQSNSSRTEIIWLNPIAERRLKPQSQMFLEVDHDYR